MDKPIMRVLKMASIMGCEHFILDPDHYRDDQTCMCDDPDHEIMSDWGYAWDDERGRWV